MTVKCLKRAPTHDQIKYCTELLDGHSVGKRGVFDGAYFNQLFGMLAQTIVADLVKEERPKCLEGPDQGHDIVINGVKIDVKCALRDYAPKNGWACNLTGPQTRYDCDAYLFVSYEKPAGIFHIMGWMYKSQFLSRAVHNPVGKRIKRDDGTYLTVSGVDFFEVPIARLNKIRAVEDLRKIK